MDNQGGQIFDESFEEIWKSFDEVFRAKLLERIRQMGSLHRLTGDDERINTEYSGRFYEALEETLGSGEFVPKWKRALVGPVPKSMDELSEIFQLHSIYPIHAFYLLLVFIHEYPLRGFFSGRDVPLPFNTLTLKFQQLLSDPLPTGVDYELDMIRLDRCPGLAYDPEISPTYQTEAVINPLLQGGGDGLGNHPQHHRWDLIWVWHFYSPPVIFEP